VPAAPASDLLFTGGLRHDLIQHRLLPLTAAHDAAQPLHEFAASPCRRHDGNAGFSTSTPSLSTREVTSTSTSRAERCRMSCRSFTGLVRDSRE